MRNQIKQALFIDDPLPALTPKSYGSFSPTPGVITERVTYGTNYGMRVPAIVYRPAQSGKHRQTTPRITLLIITITWERATFSQAQTQPHSVSGPGRH